MRRLKRHLDSSYVTLNDGAPIGMGGEAAILHVFECPQFAAKVYHEPTPERAAKLAAMLSHPLVKTLRPTGHLDVAWPLDLLIDSAGLTVGFLMPNVSRLKPVTEFFTPVARRQVCPQFTYRYLVRTAFNLSVAFESLHLHGLIVGDVNESNVLASDQALVTLVDTDSFQVRDEASGIVYRCTVGKPDYTPPHLQNVSFATTDRVVSDDYFGLAVLVFQILMEGTHPFAGVWLGDGDPPLIEERIAAGHFCWGGRSGVPYRTLPTAPPWDLLAPPIRNLMLRAFVAGHLDPTQRPSALDWKAALRQAEHELITCRTNPLHEYGMHLSTCPWCIRRELLSGRDPFPQPDVAPTAEASGTTVQPRESNRHHHRPATQRKGSGLVTPRRANGAAVGQTLFLLVLLIGLLGNRPSAIAMAWVGLVAIQFSNAGCACLTWFWLLLSLAALLGK